MATPVGLRGPVITVERPADSGPGEIYPTIVDVPFPGCWHFSLHWGPNQDAVDLLYVASE
jgi:hypothetical protein